MASSPQPRARRNATVSQNLVIGRYHVAGAADRAEQLRRVVFVDFPTQAADLNIDDIGLWIKVIIPERLEQHSPGDHLPLVPHRVFEKAELARLKRDRPTRTLRPSCPQIESQIGDPKLASVLSRRAATEQCFYPRKQLGQSKRLGQIIVTATTQPPHPLIQARQCAKYQDRCRFTEIANGGND